MLMEVNFKNLEKSICDTIKEGQIKLGYEKETMTLYYPISSLQSLLDLKITKEKEEEEILKMTAYMENFKDFVSNRLGTIKISNKSARFSFTIPTEGVRYVHESYKASQTFLEFVHLVSRPGVSLDQIMDLFHKFSPDVNCLNSDNMDFDYIIYFEDSKIDPYLYCVKFHGFGHGHVSYHRYLKSDFDELMGNI